MKLPLLTLALLAGGAALWLYSDRARGQVPGPGRAKAAADRVRPDLKQDLAMAGLRYGDPVFLRIHKEERELEVWIQEPEKETYRHFRSYPIAAMSGGLGPKTREGDRQAPEGFYYVSRSGMKPDSQFHLAFNLGYPNAYDRAHGRTGSFLMVHGNRVSIGCFAMTDARIEEIYTLCDAALKNGQEFFRVHAFPFRMTEERLAKAKGHRWENFWKNLAEGYQWFEKNKRPPNVTVGGKRYLFGG